MSLTLRRNPGPSRPIVDNHFFVHRSAAALCGAVIQDEAKPERSSVRHEAGMPWHESAAVATWGAQPRKLSSDHPSEMVSMCSFKLGAEFTFPLCR
jgi:hypothetical protein